MEPSEKARKQLSSKRERECNFQVGQERCTDMENEADDFRYL